MKISHGSQAASVVGKDFSSPEALIDSPASSTHLRRVGLVDNPHNYTLELLGLQYEFVLKGIMRLRLHRPTRLAPKERFRDHLGSSEDLQKNETEHVNIPGCNLVVQVVNPLSHTFQSL